MIEKILPFLIAIGIGLAIGIERERRYSGDKKPMGVRTFTLIAVLGAIASIVDAQLIAAAITLFAASLIVAGYIQTTRMLSPERADFGLTSEFAAGVTYVIGFLAGKEPFLATFIGLVTLVVLLSRERLHDFSTKQISPKEIQAAVILLVLGLGILPLLPAEPVDAWGILSPYRFFSVLILIGSVQFAGYIATRFFGAVIGFPLAGFLSGFVSSTVVFLTMPQRVKENAGLANSAAAASLFSAVSTFVFLLTLIRAVSGSVFEKTAAPLFASAVIGAMGAYLLTRLETNGNVFPEPKNPLSLLGVLKLAVLLSGFMIVIGAVQHLIGPIGTQVTSFIAGMGELHGVSLASASLFVNGEIAVESARNNILLAACASLVSKLLITWVLIRGRYALWITLVIGLMLTGFLITWMFF